MKSLYTEFADLKIEHERLLLEVESLRQDKQKLESVNKEWQTRLNKKCEANATQDRELRQRISIALDECKRLVNE